MIEKTAGKLADRLLKNNIITGDSREIYIYGFELAISSIANLILILALAFLYRRPWDAVIYTLCTRPLRMTGGGWHADTHWLCMTLHAIAFSIVSWVSFLIWTSVPWFMLLIIFIASFVVAWVKAPAEHPNNPLEEVAKRRLRWKCMLYLGSLAVAAMITVVLGQWYIAMLVTLSSASAAGTLMVPNKQEHT